MEVRRCPVRIHHILCPIDFSEGSRRALDHAVALARWYHARLSVVHVYPLSIPVYGVSYVGPEGLQPIVLTDSSGKTCSTALMRRWLRIGPRRI